MHAFAADLVLVVHATFVMLVAFGGLAVVRRPAFALVHAPAVAWAALVELNGWICPLTPLEYALRRAAGEIDVDRDFIDRALTALLYPAGLERSTQVALGIAVVAVNAALYALAWRVHRGRARTS